MQLTGPGSESSHQTGLTKAEESTILHDSVAGTVSISPPVKSFETLVQDVQKLLDGADLSKTVQEFSDRLGAMVAERFLKHGEERLPKLYLSNVGRPLRQLWYELNGFKGEPLSPETKFKFLYGDLIEQVFLFLAVEAGHTVERLQERVEVDGVSGKIDAVIDGILVDVKSCSSRSFEKFEKGTLYHDDPFGYIAQLTGYRQALGTERAAFVAIDKVLGKICTYELSESAGYDVSKRITEVKAAIKSPNPPERCYAPRPISKTDKSGNFILSTGCNYCAHKLECWKDSNEGKGLQIRYYSSGPKWFTEIVREPRLKFNTEDYESFPVKE